LWVSIVNFASITLCVASQREFMAVVVRFVMTQSGNFWTYPRKLQRPTNLHITIRSFLGCCAVKFHGWKPTFRRPCCLHLQGCSSWLRRYIHCIVTYPERFLTCNLRFSRRGNRSRGFLGRSTELHGTTTQTNFSSVSSPWKPRISAVYVLFTWAWNLIPYPKTKDGFWVF
jgi:hypothetical protein